MRERKIKLLNNIYYYNIYFFNFRYPLWCRVPPGIRVPQVEYHCSKQMFVGDDMTIISLYVRTDPLELEGDAKVREYLNSYWIMRKVRPIVQLPVTAYTAWGVANLENAELMPTHDKIFSGVDLKSGRVQTLHSVFCCGGCNLTGFLWPIARR
jgi:hypothetical protein